MKNIALSRGDDGILLATLDMPGRPFNVFSEDMMDDLEGLVEAVSRDCEGAGAPLGLVITSGKSSFVAGADLGMIQDFGAMRFRADWQQMRDRYSRLGKLFRRLEKLPIPTVAAINGLALGGGLELAMACHGRVAALGRHVQLGLPEILLGLLPGAGGTQRLPRLVGLEQGTKMLLGGAPVSPEQALELGLVNAVSSPESLIDSAKELIADIAASAPWDAEGYSQSELELALVENGFVDTACRWADVSKRDLALYPAFSAIMSCVQGGFALDMDGGSDVEWDIFVDLMSHPVSSNMVTTCFLSKTAATKLSQAELPSAAVPASYSLEPSLGLGDAPFRKIPCEATGEIALMNDAAQSAVNALLARNIADAAARQSTMPELRYVGDFAKSEVIELARGSNDAHTASCLALVAASGKAVVLTSGKDSINDRLLAAMRALAEASTLSTADFADACVAVGLETLASKALGDEFAAGGGELGDEEAKSKGADLLARLAQVAYQYASEELPDQPAKAARFLAGIDLLAVYGAGFPKWTGGPLSCLVMLQRGELTSSVFDAESEFKYQFKDAAGYAIVAA